jgi:hypothetical protein
LRKYCKAASIGGPGKTMPVFGNSFPFPFRRTLAGTGVF